MAKSKVFLYLTLLISTLACGVQSTLPVYKIPTPTQKVSIFVTASPTPETMQITGSWNIRETPGGEVMTTLTNAEVRVISCKPYAGGMWCFVEYQGVRGWVNQRGLK